MQKEFPKIGKMNREKALFSAICDKVRKKFTKKYQKLIEKYKRIGYYVYGENAENEKKRIR